MLHDIINLQENLTGIRAELSRKNLKLLRVKREECRALDLGRDWLNNLIRSFSENAL